MRTKLFTIPCIFFLFSVIVRIQSIDPDDFFYFRIGSLRITFINQPFKDMLQGLVCVSPYYQYAFKNGFAIGAGGIIVILLLMNLVYHPLYMVECIP